MKTLWMLFLLVCTSSWADDKVYDEKQAEIFLQEWENKFLNYTNILSNYEWDYDSNISEENLKKKLAFSGEFAKVIKLFWEEIKKFPWKTFKNENLKRQFKLKSNIGSSALDAAKYEELEKILASMAETYAKGKICDFKNRKKCDLSLEPELTQILANSRDEAELKHVWVEWRKVTGRKVYNQYPRYVYLQNEAARLNGFEDMADLWNSDFEDEHIIEEFERLWQQLQPFYQQIHAYVRRELRKKYGEKIVSKTGPIPAHLLGNMWAQSWEQISKFTLPYPEVPFVDVTTELIRQNYTALKIFKEAENFFVSLDLSPMPDSFWEKSILEKPKDGRELVCHASAWDFFDGKDVRIKQCTKINGDDFYTAHHEMGHVEYFLQYKNQPKVFREGANSGFHEAVGDTISLSVSTEKHLKKIKLLPENSTSSEKAQMNHLYEKALDKIVFLPFAYLMDLYRWNIFKGKIKPENYNSEWWKLRHKYQGVEPPVDRNPRDFDAGAKYHTIGNVPYIRYFVSFVIQFQFHKALCIKADQYEPNNPKKPLHDCDIYNSKEAGAVFKKMLEMGSSRPWPEAMKVITGDTKMDAGPLLEYFKPIIEFIEKANKDAGEYIGWQSSKRVIGRNRKNSVGQLSFDMFLSIHCICFVVFITKIVS